MIKVVFTKEALRQYHRIPPLIREKLEAWINWVEVEGIDFARSIPGFKDHKLRGQHEGQRSVWLNRTWRLIYVETEQIIIVEIHAHKY